MADMKPDAAARQQQREALRARKRAAALRENLKRRKQGENDARAPQEAEIGPPTSTDDGTSG